VNTKIEANKPNKSNFNLDTTVSWTVPNLTGTYGPGTSSPTSSSSSVQGGTSSSSSSVASVSSSSSRAASSSSSNANPGSSSSQEDATPIASNIPLTHFSVQALSGGALRIEANAPTVVEIFDLKGNKAAILNVSGSQTVKLSLPGGLYFAKARGMQSLKFVAK